ncbi:unnamed protein product [Caenorhabditis bovis]|uniref:CHK kinase-like domain-containing protein n=1 Tax=Caenorhabditis bovis TaxID=2654633 RepID=A0A8S1EH06_9PELO|nr:unnamed protein product [Caenorhabditis bovis]
MSLVEAADGILETHVSWEELEAKLQETLGTNAKFGPNKTAESIGDFKGFSSKIALIEPDWTDKRDDEDLPKKFVCKICSLLSLANLQKMLNLKEEDGWTKEKFEAVAPLFRTVHNHEIMIYEIMMNELNNGHSNLKFPKLFGAQKFEGENVLRAYIITEYVENVHQIEMHETISVESMESVLRAVASYSAIGTRLSEEELKFAKELDVIQILFQQFFDKKGLQSIFRNMNTHYPIEYKEDIDELNRLFDEVFTTTEYLAKLSNSAGLLAHKQALLHGDMWGSNLLFARNERNVLTLKSLIDYQVVRMGSPGQDIARLFASCLTKNDRREKRDHLLKVFYEEFVKEIGDRGVPYTFDQLVQSYELFFPTMGFIAIPNSMQFFDFTKLSENEKAMLLDSVLDKMIGLLDDVLETHRRNLSKFPQFFQ